MPTTALIVSVPEAESLVQDLRAEFDPAAAEGVGAHITVLYPFVAPTEVDEALLSALREAFSTVAPFEFELSGIGRFPEATYLEPHPAEYFVQLTEAVVERYPRYRPYGGQYVDIVPHLTVADRSTEAAEEAERRLRSGLAGLLPIRVRCEAVEMIENSQGSWRTIHVLPIGSRT